MTGFRCLHEEEEEEEEEDCIRYYLSSHAFTLALNG
jgi:hypothetical protein